MTELRLSNMQTLTQQNVILQRFRIAAALNDPHPDIACARFRR